MRWTPIPESSATFSPPNDLRSGLFDWSFRATFSRRIVVGGKDSAFDVDAEDPSGPPPIHSVHVVFPRSLVRWPPPLEQSLALLGSMPSSSGGLGGLAASRHPGPSAALVPSVALLNAEGFVEDGYEDGPHGHALPIGQTPSPSQTPPAPQTPGNLHGQNTRVSHGARWLACKAGRATTTRAPELPAAYPGGEPLSITTASAPLSGTLPTKAAA